MFSVENQMYIYLQKLRMFSILARLFIGVSAKGILRCSFLKYYEIQLILRFSKMIKAIKQVVLRLYRVLFRAVTHFSVRSSIFKGEEGVVKWNDFHCKIPTFSGSKME